MESTDCSISSGSPEVRLSESSLIMCSVIAFQAAQKNTATVACVSASAFARIRHFIDGPSVNKAICDCGVCYFVNPSLSSLAALEKVLGDDG